MSQDTRWRLKKAARRALAFAASASGSLALRELARGDPCVRAITYHRFGDLARDPWCMPPADFAAQMRWLAAEGLAVSLADVCAFVAGEKALPRNAVLVTIDDGCRSTHSEAMPILRDAGIPAVAFVSAGLVGAGAVAVDHDEPYVDWEQLAQLHEAGIEVGSHAFDHRSLGRMSAEEARDQALRSRALLEQRLGAPVRAFAYPFGTRADSTPATDRIVAEAGYEIAFTAVHGAIRRGMRPIGLPRVKIEAGEGLAMFQQSCRGAMDAWRLVDEILPRLARARRETQAG